MLSGTSGINSLLSSLSAGGAELNAVLSSLASGHIASAAVQPADIISSELLAGELAAIDSRIQSAQRSDSVAAVADGALGQMSDLVIRAEALAVSSANTGGMSDAEIAANRMEMASIASSINRIAASTSFAGRAIFDGSMNLSVAGAQLEIPAISAATLGLVTVGGESYSLQALMAGDELFDPQTPLEILNAAGDQISTLRGQTGAFRKNVVAGMVNALEDMFANTAMSKSIIIDTDYAEQAVNLIRNQTLQSGQIKALGLSLELSLSTRDLLGKLLEK